MGGGGGCVGGCMCVYVLSPSIYRLLSEPERCKTAGITCTCLSLPLFVQKSACRT